MKRKQYFNENVDSVSGRDTVYQNKTSNINIITLNFIINDQTSPEIKEIIQKALTGQYPYETQEH